MIGSENSLFNSLPNFTRERSARVMGRHCSIEAPSGSVWVLEPCDPNRYARHMSVYLGDRVHALHYAAALVNNAGQKRRLESIPYLKCKRHDLSVLRRCLR